MHIDNCGSNPWYPFMLTGTITRGPIAGSLITLYETSWSWDRNYTMVIPSKQPMHNRYGHWTYNAGQFDDFVNGNNTRGIFVTLMAADICLLMLQHQSEYTRIRKDIRISNANAGHQTSLSIYWVASSMLVDTSHRFMFETWSDEGS